MTDLPACREFIVIPPAGEAFDGIELHRAIIRTLFERCPGMVFWMYAKGERFPDFKMIPVLSGIPEKPCHPPHYFSMPDDAGLQKVAEALFPFMPGSEGGEPAVKVERA